MSTSYALQKREQVDFMAEELGNLVEKHGLVTVDYKVGRTRSAFQQAALEVWCRQVADFFNDQGIDRAVKSPIFKKGERLRRGVGSRLRMRFGDRSKRH